MFKYTTRLILVQFCVNFSPLHFNYLYICLFRNFSAQKIRSSILTKNTIKTNLPKEYYIRKLTEQTDENDRLKIRMKTLETQARSNAEPINNNGSDNSINEFIAEMGQWEQKINAIYDVMKTTQENYFSQYSKEKMLRFRMKLKEATEKAKNAFNLDSFAKDKVSLTSYTIIVRCSSIKVKYLLVAIHV